MTAFQNNISKACQSMSNFWDITSQEGARRKKKIESLQRVIAHVANPQLTHFLVALLASSTDSVVFYLPLCSGKQEPRLRVTRFHKDLFVGSGIWVGSFLVFWLFVGSFFLGLKVKLQLLSRFSCIIWLWICWITFSQNNLEKL